MNNIRQLTKDEYPKAIELSWQVFTITGKEDFNNEGLEFFKSFIYNKKCINEIIFYGSFDNEALTGILGIKSNGKHISLFFIKPEYHRHGLGVINTKYFIVPENAKRTYNKCYITHIHPLSERHKPTPFTVFICIRSSSANNFLSRVTKTSRLRDAKNHPPYPIVLKE